MPSPATQPTPASPGTPGDPGDEDYVVGLLLKAASIGDEALMESIDGRRAQEGGSDEAGLIQRLQEELDEVERQLQDIERGELFVDGGGTPVARRKKKKRPPTSGSLDKTAPVALSREYGSPKKKRGAPKRPQTTTPVRRAATPATDSPSPSPKPKTAADRLREPPQMPKTPTTTPMPHRRSLSSESTAMEQQEQQQQQQGQQQQGQQEQEQEEHPPVTPSDLTLDMLQSASKSGRGGALAPLSTRSTRSTASARGGVAGYKAREEVGQQFLSEAKGMDEPAVMGRLKEVLFREAAKEAGVDLEELRFKTVEDFAFTTENFLPKRLPVEVAQRRFDHYERRRVRYLAMVLEQLDRMGPDYIPSGYNAEQMLKLVDQAVITEDAKMQRISSTRERGQTVLDRENEMLLKRRSKFEERRLAMEKREKELAELRRREMVLAAKRQAERQAEIDHVKSERERMDRERREAADKKLKDEQDKRDRERADRAREEAEKLAWKRQRDAHRSKVRADFKALQNHKVNTLVSRMDKKADHIEAIRRERMQELANRKEEARLRQAERLDNVNRIRRQQEHHKAKMLQKIENTTLRLKQKRELDEALQDRRRLERKLALIEKHQQEEVNQCLERNNLPGPGQYEIKSTLTGGFTMGNERPKTDIEWQIYRASKIPGPGEYAPDLTYKSDTPACTFAAGRTPSDLERQIAKAADTPGPLEYTRGAEFESDTPAFSMGNFNPMSDLEWRIKRASELPGPGDYYEGSPMKKKTIKQLRRAVLDPSLNFDRAKKTDVKSRIDHGSPPRPRTTRPAGASAAGAGGRPMTSTTS